MIMVHLVNTHAGIHGGLYFWPVLPDFQCFKVSKPHLIFFTDTIIKTSNCFEFLCAFSSFFKIKNMCFLKTQIALPITVIKTLVWYGVLSLHFLKNLNDIMWDYINFNS